MKKIRFILAATIIIVLGFIYHNYFRGEDSQKDTSEFTDEQVRIQPAPVRVSKAFIGELDRYVTASGIAEAYQASEIKPKISAHVKKITIVEGQKVSKGQLLAELNDQEYRIVLREARARLMNAQLEYTLMKKEQHSMPVNTERTSHLDSLKEKYEAAIKAYQSGVINIEEFLKIDRQYQIERIMSGQAREELMEQKSGLASAEAEYMRAEYYLNNCRIAAPFSGIVGDIKVHAGDLVAVNQPLMILVDLQRLKLKLQVLEGEIGYIKIGEVIRAQFGAFQDTVFTGRIVGINPVIDPNTRTCAVFAEIDNPKRLLKSGMYATAKVTVSRYKNRLLVPRDAVVVRDQRKLVFVVRDGKAFWCYVDTGLENDEFVEIKSSAYDLKPGEQVIVEGQFALAHDAPVNIIGEEE